MDVEEVHRLVEAVAAIDDTCHDRATLTAAINQVNRLRAWCQSRDAQLARLLAEVSPIPDDDYGRAARTSRRRAARARTRGDTAHAHPTYGAALDDGRVAGEHLDALDRVAKRLRPDQQADFAERAAALLPVAETSTPELFERHLTDEARRLRHDGGEDRLRQQRCDTRLRSGVNPTTGMWELHGVFDPVTGARLAQRLDATVDTAFAEQTPDTCPADPIERQHHLRALALVKIIDGSGSGNGNGNGSAGTGRPEFVVVIDTSDPDPVDGGPTIDWGLPVEIPRSVLDELTERADVHTIVLRHGTVLHAPGVLDLERTTRVANKAQRRALRALYATCAVPGCPARYHTCKIHHVHWWRHGGPTNLANLLPACPHHHHCIHDKGWVLELATDRTLTIHLPDGRTLTGRPNRGQRAP